MTTNEPPPFELYVGTPQHENFCRLTELFPHTTLSPSTKPHTFREGSRVKIPDTYAFNNRLRESSWFLNDTDTSALLVLQNGEVKFEDYYLTGGRNVPWISWSVAKSFISALVGVAIEERLISSVDDPISDYATCLQGSAYDGVSIRNVLQMSSGARWNEDYSDPSADVHRLAEVMAGASTLEAFVSGMVRETDPGTICQYNSADTQALGLLLKYATGRTVTDFMQEKLFEPLGMEASGHWLTDTAGMELVLGGLNLTARDFAKIGELYRNNGNWNGQQVVSESWVKASTTIPADHLMPGHVIVGGHVFPFGYGLQWWIPAGERGEFAAIGVYNQFVFVDPSRDATLVKLSANRAYGTSPGEATNREAETVAFLRAVCEALDTD